jgi:AAHS family 4-hydroxybenzoate transporter-like MFS transporter
MMQTFDLDQFLDTRKLGAMHIKVIALLVLTMLIDGYDIFAVGYVLPVLAKGLHVEPHALTATLVLQQAGLLLGAVIMGPLADRYGRKSTLLASIACFAVCSLLTTQVHTLGQFTLIRVISSVFFSGVIPNTISLASEIAPRRMRAAAVSITFCGYTGGSLIGALVQAFVLKPFGWQGAFWVGGLLPILIFLILLWQLPESLRYRVRRNPDDPRIARDLRKIDPTLSLSGSERFVSSDGPKKAGSISAGALFKGRLLPITILLWVAYVAGFMVSHVLGSWNTTVLNTVGKIPMQQLSFVIASSAVAGIIGTGTSGLVMDRFGPVKTLVVYFFGEAIALAILSVSDVHSSSIALLFMATGYFNAASLGGLNALAAILYPSQIRATGVAWASGAGRAGAMFGPLFGGFMLQHHFGLTPIYLTITIPALTAALCLLMMLRLPHEETAEPADELIGETIPQASLTPERAPI